MSVVPGANEGGKLRNKGKKVKVINPTGSGRSTQKRLQDQATGGAARNPTAKIKPVRLKRQKQGLRHRQSGRENTVGAV